MCASPNFAVASATWPGSDASSGPGKPVFTLQNAQARVQVSPMIMKVACFFSQHSPIFGQPASSQTVCSRCSRSTRFNSRERGPSDRRTRIHSGFASAGADVIPITRRADSRTVFASPRSRSGDELIASIPCLTYLASVDRSVNRPLLLALRPGVGHCDRGHVDDASYRGRGHHDVDRLGRPEQDSPNRDAAA